MDTVKLEVPTRMALSLLRTGMGFSIIRAEEVELLAGQMLVIAAEEAASQANVPRQVPHTQ